MGVTNTTELNDYIQELMDKEFERGYKEGVKIATCDIRNSLKQIEKQNGL